MTKDRLAALKAVCNYYKQTVVRASTKFNQKAPTATNFYSNRQAVVLKYIYKTLYGVTTYVGHAFMTKVLHPTKMQTFEIFLLQRYLAIFTSSFEKEHLSY